MTEPGYIERIGGAALGMVRAQRELRRVFLRTLGRTVRGRREPGELTHQMFEIGNRSLVFIAITIGFIGMVLVFQTCLQVSRVTGDLSQIGAEFMKIMTHEFAPTLTGMMLATRVGAGIAAEIGSMVVTEQVDALRMCGVDPVEYLIVPRFIASLVMTLVLAIFGCLVALASGMLTAKLSFHVNPKVFLDASHVKLGDLFVGVSKCIAYGAAIPIVSGYCGLSARGGSEGVGWATTRAVIGSSFAVIVLDFILSGVGYIFFQGASYVISFRGVKKSFGGKPVLRGLDLEVKSAECMFIIGTSGVGKSVTIKHLVGLIRPDAGEILIDGQRVDNLSERAFYPVRKRCGMVFQNSTLFDSMTILENVALPLRKHKKLGERAAEAAAMGFLSRVHMEGFAGRYPAELGDGTRKRAAIARTLALEPEIILFDEPTTGLDPVSARRIDRLIRELSDHLHVTSLVVSHDLTSIFAIADRIAFIYQGIVHVVGTPAELRASADPVVQQFIQGISSGPMETPGF